MPHAHPPPPPPPGALAHLAVVAATLQAQHWPAPLGQPLIAALLAFLRGAGSLAAVQQQAPPSWQRGPLYLNLPLSPVAADGLDAVDLRIFEFWLAYGFEGRFLAAIARRPRAVEEIHRHLAALAPDIPALLGYLLSASPDVWFAGDDQPRDPPPAGLPPVPDLAWQAGLGRLTPLGALVQSYLRAHLDTMLRLRPAEDSRHLGFARMLLELEPPEIARAWPLALGDPSRTGYYAALLLRTDPARFRDYARAAAGPDSPASAPSRLVALRALLAADPTGNLDLAAAAAQTRLPLGTGDNIDYQTAGLEAIWRHDPGQDWSLIEAASLHWHPRYSRFAVQLLAGADPNRARPALQHVIAAGGVAAAQEALAVLLTHAWDGRQAYLVTLLAHRSSQVRATVSAWLLAHDPAVVADVAPLLTHRRVAVRLAAVAVLRQAGGPAARALLTAREPVEKAVQVRDAIRTALATGFRYT